MAYINVAEWSPDQVTDWLKGLDDTMYNYVYSFTNNQVGGKQLLNIRPYELEQLGMTFIGHQEIVLEAVEHLRNAHYNFDKENLQFLTLHVASAAHSLYKQLTYDCGKSKLETQILKDISRTIATTKPIIGWLDRAPFQGQLQFIEIRKTMLRLGLEMATIAQRDRFVEDPVEQIRTSAWKLSQLADYIIQDISDPMLLQPCSLNLVTLKKRESELGFNVEPSYHGIHRISDIKYNSPAHNSGKIEDGDEIVQINYQTVVGWQYKSVMLQLRDSPPDLLITLKKRPKHMKIYGQIYMQPYRLPSKKRSMHGRWGDNLPSPRPNLLAVQDFRLPLKNTEKHNSSDTDSSCSDIMTPTDSKSVDKEIRLYMPKPRAVLQRRNTICGSELSNLKNIGNVPFWHERKARQNGEASSPSLRDKSVSFGFGLDTAPRPTTCLGITGNTKFNDLLGLNNSLAQILYEKQIKMEDKSEHEEQKSKPGVSKVVRFDANMKYDDYPADNKYTCNVENTILETFEPIPYADDDDVNNYFEEEKSDENKDESGDIVQCINAPLVSRRGRLDKSHSTPAYDNSGDDSDTPPAIEPRKEFLQNTPPAPPPRPRRQADIQPPAIPPPPKPQPFLLQSEKAAITHSAFKSASIPTLSTMGNIPATIHFLQETTKEESELVTPTKTKSLTLKKKNSLLAKRRQVTLKALGTSDIQGHLYRRTKDKRGVTFWAKLYFVLIETVLYGFKKKDSRKASCMVFLPGFTVSLAKEVHSKPFAFKVYHPMKTFYFAAESVEALNQWMEFIRQATLQEKVVPDSIIAQNIKEFYSETDSSGDDEDIGVKQLCTPSPIAIHLSRSPLYSNSNPTSPDTPTTSSSPSKHERYLGSLKKFTQFKSAEKKPSSNDIPVPTAQYRSYRKVPGGTHGLQIGTNTNTAIYHHEISAASTPLQSFLDLGRKQSISSTYSIDSRISNSDQESIIQHTEPIAFALNSSQQERNVCRQSQSSPKTCADSTKKLRKNSPYNYIHASNPNLVEFDFQTSKSMDFSLPKINPSNTWDAHNNLQGFVTLKDLMLRKQEEEAREVYNNRVLLGVEKKDERLQKHNRKCDCQNSGGRKLSKIQSRSLPKTPDYEMSFNPDDEDIKRTRTKEGQKLRDFGYEFIYGDEPANGAQKTRAIVVEKTTYGQLLTSKKKTSQSSISEMSEKSSRGGSFKKTKGKFEAFKTSSERLFQFKHSSDHHKSSKNAASYAPLTLPLNKKTSSFYSQLDQPSPQVSIKKSLTYNAEFKDSKKIESARKNSTGVPMLTKIVMATKTPMERKLLGSPSLHRAIFGRQHSNSSSGGAGIDLDHEVFSPMVFSKSGHMNTDSIHTVPDELPSQSSVSTTPSTTASSHTTPDYPNMEYPPVFEAETYSLSDPNASLNLLRRRNDLDD